MKNTAREIGISNQSLKKMQNRTSYSSFRRSKKFSFCRIKQRARVQKCRQLICRAAGQQRKQNVLIDEKLYNVEKEKAAKTIETGPKRLLER